MSEQVLTEQELQAFHKISNFISSLNDVYGKSNFDVALYNRLLLKTKLSFRKSIRRHIQVFTVFCQRNSDALVAKDFNLIVSDWIEFSDKVKLNLKKVLAAADENRGVVWQHLLAISLCIDPSAKIREALKQSLEGNETKEGKLLNNFFNKIDSSVNKEQISKDPMAAASSMLNSGVVTELLGSLTSGVQNGELNMGNLMGSIQGIMGALTSQMGNGGGGDNNPLGGAGNPLGGIMNMMAGMMGNMNLNNSGPNSVLANLNNNSSLVSSTAGSTPVVVPNEDTKAPTPSETPSANVNANVNRNISSANNPD